MLRTPFSLLGRWPAPAEKQWSTKETFTLLSVYFPLVCLTVSRVHKYFTHNFELLFGLSKNRGTMYLPEKNNAIIKLRLSSNCYVRLHGARTCVSLSCELTSRWTDFTRSQANLHHKCASISVSGYNNLLLPKHTFIQYPIWAFRKQKDIKRALNTVITQLWCLLSLCDVLFIQVCRKTETGKENFRLR